MLHFSCQLSDTQVINNHRRHYCHIIIIRTATLKAAVIADIKTYSGIHQSLQNILS